VNKLKDVLERAELAGSVRPQRPQTSARWESLANQVRGRGGKQHLPAMRDVEQA
jgi:hypothetical protein